MRTVRNLLGRDEKGQGLDEARQAEAAAELSKTGGGAVYEASVSLAGGKVLALMREGRAKRLIVVGKPEGIDPFGKLPGRRQSIEVSGEKLALAVVDRSHESARALRQALPWTGPVMVGLTRSVGLGDRLGLATPGHLQAVRGSGCAPYLAQQSIREMSRTERTPAGVMDDATWGVFEAGWREGFGSDADHLKTPTDIEACNAVGFTMFTIDPGDHVAGDADAMDASALSSAFEHVDWRALETSSADFLAQYADRSFAIDGSETLTVNRAAAVRAAVKYGGAITHTTRMYRHLAGLKGPTPFELEVSVDETATPTTVAEHYLIAAELRRLGVRWVSLAPRFIGEFEKGIDYKGDLAAFERVYARHAAVARTLGPYKLSLHSGSDKFSVYPIAARLSGELVHVKTAGTSYLEALRVVARKRPDLFRRILAFAFERFDEDRASYHISARREVIPRADSLADDRLETVLDGTDGRQLLHVTYGSVLTSRDKSGGYRFREELREVLTDHEDEHYGVLAAHLGRHVSPFAK